MLKLEHGHMNILVLPNNTCLNPCDSNQLPSDFLFRYDRPKVDHGSDILQHIGNKK